MDYTKELLIAVGALLAGMILENFRSKIWVWQEAWKHRYRLYHELLTSLDRAGLALLRIPPEDLRPGKTTPEEIAEIDAQHDRARRRIRRLRSLARILSPRAHDLLMRLHKQGQVVHEAMKMHADRLATLETRRATLKSMEDLGELSANLHEQQRLLDERSAASAKALRAWTVVTYEAYEGVAALASQELFPRPLYRRGLVAVRDLCGQAWRRVRPTRTLTV